MDLTREKMNEHIIIPPKYAIDSMMYSGYKDAAYAVSELIDNSIQAGENMGRKIDVQVICIERETNNNDRRGLSISHIGVYDNSSGMTTDVLQAALQFGGTTRRYAASGMGKFGMGLPNASISQANRVEVYSWQNGECFYTYLDVDEIKKEAYVNVPEPKKKNIPNEWKERIEQYSKIEESGTLVVWSNLDRLKWKRHTAFFQHTEFLIGRIYRYFINDEKASIRLSAYLESEKEATYSSLVKPNDPLYLMVGTNAPAEFSSKAAFEEFPEKRTIQVKDVYGNLQPVTIRSSVATQETRNIAHHNLHPFSKHAARNVGISLIRAGREIEMNQTFLSSSIMTLERWWGIEVSFEPTLDAVFGITNNKQAAINFRRLTKEDVAAEEQINVTKVMDLLEENNDPTKGIIDITLELERILRGIRAHVSKTGVPQNKSQKNDGDETSLLEQAADNTVNDRMSEGKIGASDKKNQNQSEIEKREDLEKEIEDKGLTSSEKEQTIIEWLKKDKFIFDYVDGLPYPSDIVSFSTPAGKIKVAVNTKHPVWINIIETIQNNVDDQTLEKVKDSIMLLFASLARAEDEIADERKKEIILDHRSEWGRIARDMLRKYNNE